jgi:glycosyltransferase involved in cell wall biosynthesis
MRIGMILNAGYPEDIRITKEAKSLVEAGHEVFLLCAKRKGEKTTDTVNDIKITRADVGTSLYVTTFWDTINAAFWHHPLYARHLKRFVQENKIDILHVHDLPLTNTALKVARKFGIKVILDMHENYPAGLVTWSKFKTNPIVKLKNRLFFNYDRWFQYEKKMCKEVDGIIAVVKEMKRRVKQVHKISDEKIVVVTNNEPKSFAKKFTFYEELREPYKDRFLILYIGNYGPHRGIDTAIKGMPEVVKAVPEALFLIVGKGSIKKRLEQMVEENGLENNVKFLGFQPFKHVFTFMKMSDINLIPHNRNEHTDNTIPHKLYQSLMVGKPVLVSDCDPLKRIVTETDGGFIFEAENPSSFAERVIFIKNNPAIAEEKTKNALKHTLEGDYNWSKTAEALIGFYKKFKPAKNA